MNCIVTRHPDEKFKTLIPSILLDLGMIPLAIADDWNNSYTVLLDGRVIGLIEDAIVSRVVEKLRLLKIEGEEVRSFLIQNRRFHSNPLFIFRYQTRRK